MPSNVLFRNATVVLKNGILPRHSVLCRDGRIVAIMPSDRAGKGQRAKAVDLKGQYLVPGFIDLHIHGMQKFLIDDGPDSLRRICDILPRYGVTGFLPGVCPRPKGKDSAFVKTLASVRSAKTRIFGFHMEGPFLTMTGALPKDALGSADPARVRALMDASKPYKAVFSISPDFEDIVDLLPIMRQTGAPVFMTHTHASVKQTQAAIAAGARHATHFYDVFPIPEMTEPGVRPSGTVEAILADPRVSVDFILDGEHVDPIAVRAALACKGPDRVCLITDANIGAGLPPGRYKFLGVEVVSAYEGGPARLAGNTDKPGVLAGSGLTLDRAMRNAVRMLDVDVPQAVRMVSANPAKVLGIDNMYGEIREGYAADLVVLDEALEVQQTWIDGRNVFRK